MKDPQHPVSPAFEKAADKLAGWRKQQIAALTPEQRQEFNRVDREQKQNERQHSSEFYENRYGLIEEEKRHILREKPAPALRMLPGRMLKDSWAHHLAKGVVDARHEAERKTMLEDHQKILDGRLRAAEQERGGHQRTQPVLQTEFQRSASKEIQKGFPKDLGDAVRNR